MPTRDDVMNLIADLIKYPEKYHGLSVEIIYFAFKSFEKDDQKILSALYCSKMDWDT